MRKFLPSLFRKKPAPVVAPPVETRTLAAILDAADNLETVWGKCIAYEAAGHFTCAEAEALAELFSTIGLEDMAEKFIEYHAHSDDDEYDMHHDKYEELTAPNPFALTV